MPTVCSFIYLFDSTLRAEELNTRKLRGNPARRLLVCVHYSGLKQMVCNGVIYLFLPRTFIQDVSF